MRKARNIRMNNYYTLSIREIYTRVLKKGYRVWMSKLNDFDEIKLNGDITIISMEGRNERGDYEARRVALKARG